MCMARKQRTSLVWNSAWAISIVVAHAHERTGADEYVRIIREAEWERCVSMRYFRNAFFPVFIPTSFIADTKLL
jgi:hypothetical protein